ncbi:hypothetical protein KPL71_009499 [Citrus sinensis]|uniref:Uncharacterized protein n=1 Tax=Citrus sinensis TaxID=2711 RepID=A0ACB8MEE1_CITSI|nr:hypothetical protein KPL71_009499 [Citrus sinensis]
MKVVGRNKRKECEIKGGIEVVGDDAIIDGGRKRQCRNGFIRYFGEVVCQMKKKDRMTCITKEIRKEVGSTYKNLPAEEKCRYKSEAKRVRKSKIGKAKFLTRCAPDRLAAAVSQLTDEQRVVVREMDFGSLLQLNCGRLKRNLCGWLVEKIDIARCILQLNGVDVELSPKSFSYVMGISDGGNPLQLEGESSKVSAYLDKFTPTSRGGVHISCGFLFSLKDVQSIPKRNWATFCFHRLIQGITRHKEEQMLYFNSIVYGKLERDRSMCPLALWNVYEIKKLMKWIDSKGGFDSHQVLISSPSKEGCQLHSRRNFEKEKCGMINTAAATDTYVKADNVSNLVDDVAKLVSLSSRLAGHVDKLKSLGSRTMNGGVENLKDCSKCFNTRKGQLCVDRYNQVRAFADGDLAEMNEDEIMKSLGDVVGIVETNGAHRGIVNEGEVECSNNLTTDGNCEVLHAVSAICSGFTGESSILGLSNKQADLSGTRPSAVVGCYREHAGYRAGPYIMPMPLSNNDTRLIEFAMNVMLDKGEVLMKSKHNSITRNEILSMAPRSLVKFEIVSAIAEILTEHEIKNVECEQSSCFMSAAFSLIQVAVDLQLPNSLMLTSATASKRAKALLDIDHTYGYLDIYQYIDEMKKLHTRNTVILETEKNKVVGDAIFKRLFVCFAEPAYAFKYECRMMLFVDGWKLKRPYESVMLVAAAIDGNDGILLISFCEVLNEDIDSWVFFLTNLTKALNMEHGEGLCILTDGENGLDYVCEEYLFHGEIRQCCRNIFTKFVKTFPDAPVQHLFWAACRSASSYKFNKYMKLITDESEECHAWLMGTNWNQWALHCMPNWVKSNYVTLMVTERLRRFMKRYLHLSITHRDTYGSGMNTLPKEFPWMSQVSTVLLLPPCAHATILEDTPYRIRHTKQISPRSATTLAAGENFLRLPSSSSDEDSITQHWPVAVTLEGHGLLIPTV